MAPPAYADIGRDIRDVLSKNYHSGYIKVNCKSDAPYDLHITANGQSQINNGALSGSLEAKYKLEKMGATLKQKYTSSVITTDVCLDKLPLENSKVNIVGTVSHSGLIRNILIKNNYVHPLVNLGVDMDISKISNNLTASAVTSKNNCVIGTQVQLKGKEMGKVSTILGHKGKNTAIYTSASYMENLQLGAQIYHKPSPNLTLAGQLSLMVSNLAPSCEIGCVAKVAKDTKLRAVASTSRKVGVGITQNLKHGVSVSVSAVADDVAKQLKPKLGLSIDIE